MVPCPQLHACRYEAGRHGVCRAPAGPGTLSVATEWRDGLADEPVEAESQRRGVSCKGIDGVELQKSQAMVQNRVGRHVAR